MRLSGASLLSRQNRFFTAANAERYREVVEQTLDYLVRELRLPEGGFASSQDADTLGEEGLTYVWAPEELAEIAPSMAIAVGLAMRKLGDA